MTNTRISTQPVPEWNLPPYGLEQLGPDRRVLGDCTTCGYPVRMFQEFGFNLTERTYRHLDCVPEEDSE